MLIDTIVAQASAVGAAGVAVVRISGPKVKKIIKDLGLSLSSRVVHFADLLDADNSVIDNGLWLYFQGPRSFTGEDVLEFQGHGNQWVVASVIQRFCDLGCRLAEPGEFSKRAFLNNKIDLVQAEAVADLVAARSAVAAKMALLSLSGEFSHKIDLLVESLVNCRVQLEAAMDFPEDDIELDAIFAIKGKLSDVIDKLKLILSIAEKGAMVQSGLDVALIGPPNVGKSSLFNALLGRDEAIVTDISGTTRDILKQECRIGSTTIMLQDTAGLRNSRDAVEQEGMRRARMLVESAQIILLVLDDRYIDVGHDAFLLEHDIPSDKILVPVWNKCDLFNLDNNLSGIKISVKEESGFSELFSYLDNVAKDFSGGEEHGYLARARHVHSLKLALISCESSYEALTNNSWELAAEDCRYAQRELSSITGEFSNDDLLTKIFSEFCIGK